MFKDKISTTTPPVDGSGTALQATITEGTGNGAPMLDATSDCIQVAANCTGTTPQAAAGGFTASQNTATALNASTNFGWYITLASGEKQIGGTVAAAGALLFATNQPSASAGGGACSPNLGVARQYSVSFLDGTSFSNTSGIRSTTYAGGGYLPSPVLVYVGLGGSAGTGNTTGGGVPVGGTISGSQLKVGAGATTGGGNDPTGVVCFGASCALAPGVQLYSRLRKFWYKEMD
jgi:type IV pilus assembly protein PilY1